MPIAINRATLVAISTAVRAARVAQEHPVDLSRPEDNASLLQALSDSLRVHLQEDLTHPGFYLNVPPGSVEGPIGLWTTVSTSLLVEDVSHPGLFLVL